MNEVDWTDLEARIAEWLCIEAWLFIAEESTEKDSKYYCKKLFKKFFPKHGDPLGVMEFLDEIPASATNQTKTIVHEFQIELERQDRSKLKKFWFGAEEIAYFLVQNILGTNIYGNGLEFNFRSEINQEIFDDIYQIIKRKLKT